MFSERQDSLTQNRWNIIHYAQNSIPSGYTLLFLKARFLGTTDSEVYSSLTEEAHKNHRAPPLQHAPPVGNPFPDLLHAPQYVPRLLSVYNSCV